MIKNSEAISEDNNSQDIELNNFKFLQKVNLKNIQNFQKKDLLHNPKYRSYFQKNEILYYEEDEQTEYKEYIPNFKNNHSNEEGKFLKNDNLFTVKFLL